MRHQRSSLEGSQGARNLSLGENNTWVLQDLHSKKKTISYKWVYHVNYNSHYSMIQSAFGDSWWSSSRWIWLQRDICTCGEMITARCFLSVVVSKGWELHQLEVNNAFLYGDLDKEVYMTLPRSFTCSTPIKVCRLQKSLYGLHQAPRQWFAKLSSKLCECGCIHPTPAIHYLLTERGIFLWLCCYMSMTLC